MSIKQQTTVLGDKTSLVAQAIDSKEPMMQTGLDWYIIERHYLEVKIRLMQISENEYEEGLKKIEQQAKEMEKSQIIDFGLFHSARMKYALQKDNEFYANQTFLLWLKGENQKSEEKKQDWIMAQKFVDNLIHNSYIHKENDKNKKNS